MLCTVMPLVVLAGTSEVIYLKQSSGSQVNMERQFIYYYHDSPNPEEVNDAFSGMAVPTKGEVIERRGKKYEVRSVQPVVGKAIPTYIIRLMNTM
jgi:hypothetical protein